MADGGKGSTQRPRSVSDEEWASRYDAIFQRDLPKLQHEERNAYMDAITQGTGITQDGKRIDPESVRLPASLIKGIMSTETCGHPFCQCVDVCKEAK